MPTTECDIARLKQAYQVLGVPVASSALSIKQAYRRLTKRWHPDLYANGTPTHAEATYNMMKVVNEAYSRVAHAPLRYHIESYPKAREKRDQRPRAPQVEVGPIKRMDQDTLPITHRLEFWVRFAFGALLGLIIGLRLLLVCFERPRVPTVIATCLVIACGLAAARWGDKFWQKVFTWCWLWW